MDSGETYIKMCDCPEIQKQRVIANGDFEVRFKHNRGQVEIHHHREITAHYKPEDHLWLPRQDQLQEMVTGDLTSKVYSFYIFTHPESACLHGNRETGYFNREYCKICTDERNRIFRTFTSMEQLWLAFVMKELHNKLWDGAKWIAQELDKASRTVRGDLNGDEEEEEWET
uniref:Uncharacterized protein n=1 Tax=viral metagenome TaxID=1070528 RepID=A0A6H1ZFY2_9ZZZZ